MALRSLTELIIAGGTVADKGFGCSEQSASRRPCGGPTDAHVYLKVNRGGCTLLGRSVQLECASVGR